jgi:hypothetical protein
MNNESKIAMFDYLVGYVINSSYAMNDTAKILALDPLHISEMNRLNEFIDLAKCLMTKVIY